MKKMVLMLCAGCFSIPAVAQFYGLPIADGASAPAAGETRASAGAVLAGDFNLYGGRLLFAPLGRLALFADFGAMDPAAGDLGSAFQGGAKFTLPLKADNPVDVALRATWAFASYDTRGGDLKMNGFNVGALVSREVERLTPYAFLGLNFVDAEVDINGPGRNSKDETDLAVAAGVLLRLVRHLSLYGELAHVDELMFNAGARWTF